MDSLAAPHDRFSRRVELHLNGILKGDFFEKRIDIGHEGLTGEGIDGRRCHGILIDRIVAVGDKTNPAVGIGDAGQLAGIAQIISHFFCGCFQIHGQKRIFGDGECGKNSEQDNDDDELDQTKTRLAVLMANINTPLRHPKHGWIPAFAGTTAFITEPLGW